MYRIMAKDKRCKGGNKAINFEGCGEIKKIHKYGLCLNCFTQWLNTTEEGNNFFKSSLIRGRKKAESQIKKERAEEKRNLTNPIPELQKKINEIVRLIDYDLPCLARYDLNVKINAGHIYSVGSSPSMRFNLHNIHRQGAVSNNSQKDDGLMRINLGIEYGNNYLLFLDTIKKNAFMNLSRLEAREKISICNSIIKEMKPFVKLRTLEDRINLRNEINLKLNIYPENLSVYKINKK